MKYTTIFLALSVLVVVGALGQNSKWELPKARVSVRVIDEAQSPITSASVRAVFSSSTNHTDIVPAEGLTDSLGQFIGEGYTDGVIGSWLSKDGYYNGWATIPNFQDVKGGRWQPWDATYTTILRKIENPIPMYALVAVVNLPVKGKPCGYDLKAGDWVAPWGNGLVADFVFTAESRYTNYNHFDSSMKLAFSNPLDGIQPANLPPEYAYGEFIWHRQAPETGYLAGYEQEKGMPGKHYQIPGVPGVQRLEDVQRQKFYFRVRTDEKDGRIVSALYGKLSAGFEMRIPDQQELKIVLYYYLNPTPLDRNMEFDLEKNLFKNLSPMERPRKP